MSTRTQDPVRVSVLVHVPVERAWTVFTDGISDWWPVELHSITTPERVVVEGRVGGEIYEEKAGVREHWATILVWEPPDRLVVAWQVNRDQPAPTEWEATFTRDGDGTRVTLEHYAWERLGAGGEESREGYANGWVTVLGRYEAHVDG